MFDPALISLLARYYSLAHENIHLTNRTNLNEHIARTSSTDSLPLKHFGIAINACETNYKVAKAAGLYSRESMWNSLISLIPSPVSVANNCMDLMNILNHPFEIPLAEETIATLLVELLDGGDSQHFVVLAEILKKTNILQSLCLKVNITDYRVRQAYLAYIDLLTKLQLFCEANEIIKASDDVYISSLSKQGVEIHTKCGKCNKELMKTNGAWCLKCTRYAAICSVCNMPVKGLLHWCPVCSHGNRYTH